MVIYTTCLYSVAETQCLMRVIHSYTHQNCVTGGKNVGAVFWGIVCGTCGKVSGTYIKNCGTYTEHIRKAGALRFSPTDSTDFHGFFFSHRFFSPWALSAELIRNIYGRLAQCVFLPQIPQIYTDFLFHRFSTDFSLPWVSLYLDIVRRRYTEHKLSFIILLKRNN